MTVGIDVGQVIGVLLGGVAMIGLTLHHRVWLAHKERIRTEADAFGGRIDRRE